MQEISWTNWNFLPESREARCETHPFGRASLPGAEAYLADTPGACGRMPGPSRICFCGGTRSHSRLPRSTLSFISTVDRNSVARRSSPSPGPPAVFHLSGRKRPHDSSALSRPAATGCGTVRDHFPALLSGGMDRLVDHALQWFAHRRASRSACRGPGPYLAAHSVCGTRAVDAIAGAWRRPDEYLCVRRALR